MSIPRPRTTPSTIHSTCGVVPAGTSTIVTEYAPGAHNNAAPLATIGGSATKLTEPDGVGFDSAGDLFVADFHDVGVLDLEDVAFLALFFELVVGWVVLLVFIAHAASPPFWAR